MTWQLGSVLVLTIALCVGFGWYERSRPPARVLALVAALAALAAIGRVAFAAFPNVKPTSDIVLFSGYALGGAPGFAVGAVAALVSNVFLGQGPWTPWQMVSWAVVGLIGAAFGRVMRGREPNRWLLALVCGLSGFVFGALMDMYQWTLAAEHTPASYLAISGTSFGFNVLHAGGNVVFALILGPAFVRALERYRRRFQVRWLASAPRAAGGAAATLVLLLVLTGTATAADPPADVSPAISRAVHYLRFSQNADGGFGPARRQSSTQLHTGWTALGLAAASRNPRDVEHSGHSIISYVEAHAADTDDVGELERTLLVLRTAGLPPRIGSHNLLAGLISKQHGDGSFGTINHTAFGILALRASGRKTRSSEVRKAVRWLLREQNRDGGYGFAKTAASDVDDTGAVLQAIAAAGRRSSPVVGRAVSYVRQAQRADGGFGQMAASESNAQSTAFAIQGLVAAGRNPRKFRRTRTPIEYLKSLQAADGSVRYSRTSTQTPVWVTAQALNGLEAKPFPLPPAPRQKARSVAVAATAVRPASTVATPAPQSPTRPHRKRTAHASQRPKSNGGASSRESAAKPRLGTSHVEVRPVAATTTTSDATTSSKNGGKGSYWPFIFAAALGVVLLVALRLAWRRG
ncbi:MAG TPA: prenyltransferase/squalene oxidase repeat-containing protein [Thermoleophilaceae bacterium]|nr:prenyltransferase/squalene oxidase repeat-containing protein [Thermoleophilaceae bacterium]